MPIEKIIALASVIVAGIMATHPLTWREVHHQLLAISYLFENNSPEESSRFDLQEVYFGLGRLLEELATDIGDIADQWARWDLKKHRTGE